MSIGGDGTFFVYSIDYEAIKKLGRNEKVSDPIFQEITPFKESIFTEKIEGNEVDITDDSVYSIQEAKIRTEQDKKEEAAKKKQKT